MDQLIDTYGRIHDYVRISITDRCNLGCMYCMPSGNMDCKPSRDYLTIGEMVRIIEALAELGIQKVRLTGGEPLLYKNVDLLIKDIASLPGIHDISITTNGLFLSGMIDKLKRAGLRRVNISLDSLKNDRYSMITRGGELSKVLSGIKASLEAGFSPVKINVVLMRGINDDEIMDFIQWTRNAPIHVRFIEYMPIGDAGNQWNKLYMPLTAVLDLCKEAGWNYTPLEKKLPTGPAECFRLDDAVGTFGLIHPISEHFCESCNRLRITSNGFIKPCLFWNEEWNLRECEGDKDRIKQVVRQALNAKQSKHEMLNVNHISSRLMSQIGG